MKKRSVLIVMLLSALIFGCGKKEEAPAKPESNTVQEADASKEASDEGDKANEAGLANPWVSSDRDTVLQTLGFDMEAPEGSKDVSYMLNETAGIGEMTFTGAEPELVYTYRMKSASEFEDISGLNYTWDVEADAAIQWCEGKSKRAIAESRTIDVCLWYDVVPGVMYSLSTEGEDLDGFDITAIAWQVFKPLQGEVDGAEGEEGAEVFIPANFLEDRLKRDIFGSFDEIISLLEKDNAYVITKLYGSDEEVLLIAEGAYDNGDGNMAALEGSVYRNDNGTVKNVGNIYSQGTAYPISLDKEGKVYSGGNHEVSVECISKETKAIMSMIYAYESFDEKGNVSYGGFVRDTNSLETDGAEIDEKDPTVLKDLFEKFQAAAPLNYTVVK